MDYPDGYIHGTEGTRIFGQMTIPRELKYKNGRLYQWPVRELREYRKDKLEYSGISVSREERRFDGISGRSLALDINIASPEEGAPLLQGSFRSDFAEDDEHYISLSYRPRKITP